MTTDRNPRGMTVSHIIDTISWWQRPRALHPDGGTRRDHPHREERVAELRAELHRRVA